MSRRNSPSLLLTLALVAAVALVPPRLAAQTAPPAFLATFDGMPPAPLSYRDGHFLDGWDVQVQSRDPTTWYQLEPMDAQHGPDCAPPPATHPQNGDYSGAVFQCHDHVMTAINAQGYGAIYLTPPVVADFSQGEAVVRFDVSTLRTSPRDWLDLWVTPYDEQLALPGENWLPDLDGQPRRAVHVSNIGNSTTATLFSAYVIRDFLDERIGNDTWTPYESFLVPSAVRRDTVELRLSRTHVAVGMPAYGFWWVDNDIPDLGWSSGVVQFGHHSYNPTKCDPAVVCGPGTWHWDTVSIAPAQPFTILRADRRYVDATNAAVPVGFGGPAPPGAMLRFAAIGNAVAVSFDGGATWQPAPVQPSGKPLDPSHAFPYWLPIPAGTTGVRIRAEGGWWGSQWIAKDAALWVPPGVVVAAPTPTPTPVSPSTSTATATATNTPSVTATPTVTTTATALPATATVTPRGHRQGHGRSTH